MWPFATQLDFHLETFQFPQTCRETGSTITCVQFKQQAIRQHCSPEQPRHRISHIGMTSQHMQIAQFWTPVTKFRDLLKAKVVSPSQCLTRPAIAPSAYSFQTIRRIFRLTSQISPIFPIQSLCLIVSAISLYNVEIFESSKYFQFFQSFGQ